MSHKYKDQRKQQATVVFFLFYDMIYLRALNSWQNGQLSLAHGTETKN